MKPLYQRIVAIVIVCMPGLLAIYGITLLRDLIFEYIAGAAFQWLPFLGGLFCTSIGLYLIGSFLFYREKKNYKVQDKLLTPEEREEKRKHQKRGGNFLEKV